jgi:hypothetical protein
MFMYGVYTLEDLAQIGFLVLDISWIHNMNADLSSQVLESETRSSPESDERVLPQNPFTFTRHVLICRVSAVESIGRPDKLTCYPLSQ